MVDFFPKEKRKKAHIFFFKLYFSYISDMTELPKLLHCRFTYSVHLTSKAVLLDFKMKNITFHFELTTLVTKKIL